MSRKVRLGIQWFSVALGMALMVGLGVMLAFGSRGVRAGDGAQPLSIAAYGQGTVETLSETPERIVRPAPTAGWAFLRWSGDVQSAAQPLTVPPDAHALTAEFVPEDSLMGSLVAGRDSEWAGAERIDVPGAGTLVAACNVELVDPQAPESEQRGRAMLAFSPESGAVMILVNHTVANPVSASIRDVTESGPAETVLDLGDPAHPIQAALGSEAIAALQDSYYAIEVSFEGGAIQGLLDCVDWDALDAQSAALPAKSLEKSGVNWPQTLAEARGAAIAAIRAGNTPVAAANLLATLRSVPTDNPALVDAVHGALQLISFIMGGLLQPADLQTFLAGLDPAQYPMDGAVDLYYYRELDDYWQFRGLEPFSSEVMWGKLAVLRDSTLPLIEAIGCIQTCAPWPWATVEGEHIAIMFVAFNRLAELVPNARLTGEVLRENMSRIIGFGCQPDGGPGNLVEVSGETPEGPDKSQAVSMQAMRIFLTGLPWSPAAQAVLQADPTVSAVQAAQQAGAAARASGASEADVRIARIRALADKAKNDNNARVRDWSLRVLTNWKSLADESGVPEAVWQEVMDAHRAVANRTGSDGRQDKVRARFQWASNAIRAHRWTDRADLRNILEALIGAARDEEPADINFYEQIPRQVGYLGYALGKDQLYDEAAALFERGAGLIPNTFLGDKWLSDAQLMRRLKTLRKP